VGNAGDACGSAANTKVCGGVLRSYFQDDGELAADLAKAISNNGEHPDCPGKVVCVEHNYNLRLFQNVNFCVGTDNLARMNGMETCVASDVSGVSINPLSGSSAQLDNALYNMFVQKFFHTKCINSDQQVSYEEAFSNQKSILQTQLVDADSEMDSLEQDLNAVNVADTKSGISNRINSNPNLGQSQKDLLLAILNR